MICATQRHFERNAEIHPADATARLAMVTEWKESHSPEVDVIKATLQSSVFIDGRNLYDMKSMLGDVIRYAAI